MKYTTYDINESLTIEEYLARLPDTGQREATRKLLWYSTAILAEMNHNMQKSEELPEIRIVTNPTLNAEAISYLIRINSGLIEHCLYSKHMGYETIFECIPPKIYNSEQIAIASLSWIIAHEWTHIFRHHDKVIEELGDTPETLRALEHDADYCAIASIYRRLQIAYFQHMNDQHIREVLLYCLFWPLRTLPSLSNTHEEIGQRLCNFLIKIATLSENPHQAPDNDVIEPQTLESFLSLASLLMKCEESFQEIDDTEANKSNLIENFVRRIQDGSFTDTTTGWEKISQVVERVSSTTNS